MKRFLLYCSTVLICISFYQNRAVAQVATGFMIGPNYSYFIASKTDTRANPSPGEGFDAFLIFTAGDEHRVGYNIRAGYSMQCPHIKLTNFIINSPPGSHLEGDYQLSFIRIFPEIQFNFLKNKSLYLGLGPFFQMMVGGTGKGTYNYGDNPYDQSFKGNEILAVKSIFNQKNWGAGVSIGYRKIQIGKIWLFAELTESWQINNYFKDDSSGNGWSSQATWNDLMTTVSVGLDFYRKVKH